MFLERLPKRVINEGSVSYKGTTIPRFNRYHSKTFTTSTFASSTTPTLICAVLPPKTNTSKLHFHCRTYCPFLLRTRSPLIESTPSLSRSQIVQSLFVLSRLTLHAYTQSHRSTWLECYSFVSALACGGGIRESELPLISLHRGAPLAMVALAGGKSIVTLLWLSTSSDISLQVLLFFDCANF